MSLAAHEVLSRALDDLGGSAWIVERVKADPKFAIAYLQLLGKCIPVQTGAATDPAPPVEVDTSLGPSMGGAFAEASTKPGIADGAPPDLGGASDAIR